MCHAAGGPSCSGHFLLVGLGRELAAWQEPAFPRPARPVAPIVSPGWNSEAARDREGESSKVFDYLDLEPGIRVADIGAGPATTRATGPAARSRSVIYGEDIEEVYLGRLQARLEHEKVRGVTLVLGAPSDPELPPASVDLALMSHMYHEITDPYQFLYNLAPAIAPGGRVAVVDVDRPISRHGTPASLLKCEMGAMGYQERGVRKLDGDATYVAVFDVPAHPTPPAQIKVCRPTQ